MMLSYKLLLDLVIFDVVVLVIVIGRSSHLRVHPSMRLMTPKPSREVGIVDWGQCISTGTFGNIIY